MVEMYVGVTSPWGQTLSEPPATALWNLHDHRGLCGHVPSLFPLAHASLSGQLLCLYDAVGFLFFFLCVIFFFFCSVYLNSFFLLPIYTCYLLIPQC